MKMKTGLKERRMMDKTRIQLNLKPRRKTTNKKKSMNCLALITKTKGKTKARVRERERAMRRPLLKLLVIRWP